MPNHARGCVKSVGVKFGNDQILDMENFDEVSRRIEWSKNEFSHRLSPEPTAVGAVSSAVASVKPRGATPLYGFTSPVGGGSAFYVMPLMRALLRKHEDQSAHEEYALFL